MPHAKREHLLRSAVTVVTAVAVALIAALPAAAGEPSPTAKAQSCNDVVVQFQPEGSGGATEIKAKNIGCRKARKVIRECIRGDLRTGWSGVFDDPKFVLSKGERRIRYLPVGGGGCVPV